MCAKARRTAAKNAKAPKAPAAAPPPAHPALYQINTRVWLNELGTALGRPATLDDIPDAALDAFAAHGLDWIWFLSVWTTGEAGRRVSRENPEWRREFEETLPDLREEDIAGSGFAICAYKPAAELGGLRALARLRKRLNDRGMRLMLDFVPNHVALDHPWVKSHPEFFIAGTEDDLAREPHNFVRLAQKGKEVDRILAYGRDPYFPGWPDTLQLNYAEPALQSAMIAVLKEIAARCDGVRCDMAMLLLSEVFERTWGRRAESFWPRAIEAIRAEHPGFTFLAEVYWDLEWTLQQQGFDCTYDKRLYDRLREGNARPVREHLLADPEFQRRSARFHENHDEPRAAAVFPLDQHRAAAVVAFLAPGLRFFHQGQFQGRRQRISPHLRRGPLEPADTEIGPFYGRLLAALREPSARFGNRTPLECLPAWEGAEGWDSFIAGAWEAPGAPRLVVAVNYSPQPSKCYVRLPFSDLAGSEWRLEDLLSDALYDRSGDDLAAKGLFLDVPAWKPHVFKLTRLA
ncbi:MAG TPA: alpha-amylase family glycosyl hydrolase [Planctomycetia bacterium]|nr:alpha-amylase family glycosyl hydrolase [Planctomycetia bacterium]